MFKEPKHGTPEAAAGARREEPAAPSRGFTIPAGVMKFHLEQHARSVQDHVAAPADDAAEREADGAAARVARSIETARVQPAVRTSSAVPARKAENGQPAAVAAQAIDSSIAQARGGGEALSEPVRAP